MTGCDLIPAPGGRSFVFLYYYFVKCKINLNSFISKDILDICAFYLRCSVLNAANDDESVATAAWATG